MGQHKVSGFKCLHRFNVGTDEEPEWVEKQYRDHLWLKSFTPQVCTRCLVKKEKP